MEVSEPGGENFLVREAGCQHLGDVKRTDSVFPSARQKVIKNIKS
jgi:hypothetical protein